TIAAGKPPLRRPERVRGSTRNRPPPCAFQLQLNLPAVFRRQRNLRSSRTRDFKSSASGMETSVGMPNDNENRCKSQKRPKIVRPPPCRAAASYRRVELPGFGLEVRGDSRRKIVSPSFIKSRRSRATVSR